MRKMITMFLACVLALGLCAASAEGLSSQFGFSGWPVCQPVSHASATRSPEYALEMGSIPTSSPNQAHNQHISSTGAPQRPTAALPAATAQPASPTGMQTGAAASGYGAGNPLAGDDYTTYSPSMQEANALKLLNSDRLANGLSALTLDPELSRIARIKSEDMRDHHYFAHESPTYGRMAQMLKTFGYANNGCGENIAHHASVDRAEIAFMSSDAHRRNILMSSWTRVGIGVALDANGYVYETQVFVR